MLVCKNNKNQINKWIGADNGYDSLLQALEELPALPVGARVDVGLFDSCQVCVKSTAGWNLRFVLMEPQAQLYNVFIPEKEYFKLSGGPRYDL